MWKRAKRCNQHNYVIDTRGRWYLVIMWSSQGIVFIMSTILILILILIHPWMMVSYLWGRLIEGRVVAPAFVMNITRTMSHWMRRIMGCADLGLWVLQQYLDLVFTGYCWRDQGGGGIDRGSRGQSYWTELGLIGTLINHLKLVSQHFFSTSIMCHPWCGAVIGVK